MQDLLGLVIFVLPVYVANGLPVLLGGGIRLDLGRDFFDRKPVFGSGKTIRGFIAGVVGGTVAAGIIAFFIPLPWFITSSAQFWGGAAMALGTMVGDASGSFIKRRLGIESGRQFIPDTVVFLAFALAFAYPFVSSSFYTIGNLAFLFILTVILHPATNFLANRLGLKKVPW